MSVRAADPKLYTVGKGEFFLERFDSNGVGMGLFHAGDLESLSLGLSDDVLRIRSNMTHDAPVRAQLNRARTIECKPAFREWDAENLAKFLMGQRVTYTQLATAVVDEAVMAAVTPNGYFTTAGHVGPVTGHTVKMGATDAVLGTDFIVVDPAIPLYRITPTTILTGAVTQSYTPAVYTGTTGPTAVAIGSEDFITCRAVFKSDPSLGPKILLELWKLSCAPDGLLQLISSELSTFSLTLTALDDSANHAAPFNMGRVIYLP